MSFFVNSRIVLYLTICFLIHFLCFMLEDASIIPVFPTGSGYMAFP